MAIFQTKPMYANQEMIPSRDGGEEENALHSDFSNLGLDERASRSKDPIPFPRSATRAAIQKSSPSPDSRNTSPDSVIEDNFDSYVVVDDHDSKSMHTDLQSWVRQPSAQMSSSIDSDVSLNTCLNRAEGLSKSTRQKAYEQKLLLNNFPAKLHGDVDGGFPNRYRGDENQELQELAKKLEECERAKADGKNEATQLRQQVDLLKDENERLCSLVHGSQSFGEKDSLKAQLQKLKKDFKSLNDEKRSLQEKLDDSERKAEELKKLEKTLTKTAADQSEVNFLRQKMENLKEENKNLTALVEKADAAEAEKRQLLEDLSRRSIRGRKLEEELKRVSEEAQQKVKYVELYQNVKQENEVLKKEVEQLTLSQSDMKSELNLNKLELAGSKEEVESLQEQLGVLKFNENRIKTEAAALKLKNQEIDAESKRLRKCEKDSKQKEENLTSIIQQLQKQLEDSKKGDSDLEEEMKSLKAAMEDMEQQNVVLKRKFQDVEEQAQTLAQQNPSYEEVKQQCQQVTNYVHQCHQAMQQKDAEIRYYGDACRHFQLQLQQFQTASNSGSEELRRDLHEARETASANMTKLTEAQNQYEELKVTASKKDAQIYELQKKFKDVTDQIELYKIQVNDFEKDFNDERKRANDLNSQLEDEKEAWNLKTAELAAENKELKLRISKLDQIKLEEDERALGGRTWHAAGPSASTSQVGGGVNRVNSQSRKANVTERTVSGYRPQFDSSVDLSNSGRHDVRASVSDLRHNPAQDRRSVVSQRDPTLAERVGDFLNPRKAPAKPKEKSESESLVCPFCNERNFPNTDGLQVHINEDHPEL